MIYPILQLFFSIARGCLRLAGVLRPTASSVQNSPNHFLTNWSEPFWHGVFLESLPRQILHPNNEGSRNGVSPFPLPVPTAPLDALFDNAASQGDESAIDEESRIRQGSLKRIFLFYYSHSVISGQIDGSIN
ncbi:unnamed protein product [Protopolystoma xenopodis]|uniref:Uncharacterized protein n=1 Tax=Protopolystoma xenopodis TaxID=117903 RepID=A0A448WZS4_9PLAT|nr:unnamed protein product [Protopolystoma xenopodis]